MTVGDRILVLRQSQNLSQKDMAKMLNVSTSTIAMWEADESMPTLNEIASIGKLFNVTTDFLIHGNNTNIESCRKDCTSKRKIYTILILTVLILLSIVVTGFILYTKNVHFDSPDSLSPSEIYKVISPSTVEIYGDTIYSVRTGTGFFIDSNGTIITNFHVIDGCYKVKIILSDGTEYPVLAVLGHDKDLDIAILATNCSGSIPLTFREEAVITGEKAYTLGSSLGLTGTFAEGLISSASRKINGQNFIQTTAPISSGNSGGPLVDAYGKVIGITTAAFEEGQNLNLAVPIVLALNIDRNSDYILIRSFMDQYNLDPIERLLCDTLLHNEMTEENRKEIIEILDKHR